MATLIRWVKLHSCYRHLIVKQQDAQAPCYHDWLRNFDPMY